MLMSKNVNSDVSKGSPISPLRPEKSRCWQRGVENKGCHMNEISFLFYPR